jgi:voltage-gated potassium channel
LNTDSCWDDFWLVVWFSASTITTVGYGDMVPSTGAGRVVSIAMCVFGVVLLGFMFAAVNEALHMVRAH